MSIQLPLFNFENQPTEHHIINWDNYSRTYIATISEDEKHIEFIQNTTNSITFTYPIPNPDRLNAPYIMGPQLFLLIHNLAKTEPLTYDGLQAAFTVYINVLKSESNCAHLGIALCLLFEHAQPHLSNEQEPDKQKALKHVLTTVFEKLGALATCTLLANTYTNQYLQQPITKHPAFLKELSYNNTATFLILKQVIIDNVKNKKSLLVENTHPLSSALLLCMNNPDFYNVHISDKVEHYQEYYTQCKSLLDKEFPEFISRLSINLQLGIKETLRDTSEQYCQDRKTLIIDCDIPELS